MDEEILLDTYLSQYKFRLVIVKFKNRNVFIARVYNEFNELLYQKREYSHRDILERVKDNLRL